MSFPPEASLSVLWRNPPMVDKVRYEHAVFVGAELLCGERRRSPHGDAAPTKHCPA